MQLHQIFFRSFPMSLSPLCAAGISGVPDCSSCSAAQGLLEFKGDVLGFVCGFVCFSLCQLVHITQGELFTSSPGWKIYIKICLSILWINLSSFFLLLSLKWNYLEFFPGLSVCFYKMTKCLVLWCMCWEVCYILGFFLSLWPSVFWL